ncbi:DUF6314 family protein [Streptomyces sp. INA 01156]
MNEFWPVPDALTYLDGHWQVTRTVRDLAGGDLGRFEGTTLSARSRAAACCTRSPAPSPGGASPARRTHPALPPGPDGTVDVRFADGRPFHDLDLSTGRYVAEHPCAADLYRGEFTVHDEDRWRTLWRVRGPAKDLELDTNYIRAR